MTVVICLRKKDAVGTFVTSGDLHAKDDAGEIVSFRTPGSKLDMRRKLHAV
jgi:hypothetical protein